MAEVEAAPTSGATWRRHADTSLSAGRATLGATASNASTMADQPRAGPKPSARRRADRRLDRLLRACRHFHQGGDERRSAGPSPAGAASSDRWSSAPTSMSVATAPRPAASFSLGWRGWALAVVGALSSIAFIAAFKYTYVANVAVIYATVPFMAAAIEWLALGNRTRMQTMATAAVSLVGVVDHRGRQHRRRQSVRRRAGRADDLRLRRLSRDGPRLSRHARRLGGGGVVGCCCSWPAGSSLIRWRSPATTSR